MCALFFFTFQHSLSSNNELGIGQFVEIPALNLPSQNPTTSEPMHIEHHYDQLRNDPSNPYVIIQELREELKKVKAASAKKSKRIRNLLNCIHEMKKGKIPKVTEDIICHKRLKHKYSEAQIDEMISKSPRKRSKKWKTVQFNPFPFCLSHFSFSTQLSLLSLPAVSCFPGSGVAS